MKCNPHPSILKTLIKLGAGFEIASARELDQVVAVGADPSEVLFSNPVKPEAHIARAYQKGVWRYAFDSREELRKLAAAAPGAAVVVRLAVDPHRSEVASEGKFGVDPATAASLMLTAKAMGLEPYGVAFHVGSQALSPSAWRSPIAAAGSVMADLADRGVRLRMIDVGGGFPARYTSCPPPLAAYGAVIAEELARLPYPVLAVAEPGRSLVAEAGTLVATVIGTAVRAGRRWVHLDIGAFNGLMECLETRNQIRYPVSDSLASPDREPCHLTGPTCDSQDSIMFDVNLSAGIGPGDQVYLGSVGAYTTVYASTFNGFDAPSIWSDQGTWEEGA